MLRRYVLASAGVWSVYASCACWRWHKILNTTGETVSFWRYFWTPPRSDRLRGPILIPSQWTKGKLLRVSWRTGDANDDSPPFSAHFLTACRLSSTLFTRLNGQGAMHSESKAMLNIKKKQGCKIRRKINTYLIITANKAWKCPYSTNCFEQLTHKVKDSTLH